MSMKYGHYLSMKYIVTLIINQVLYNDETTLRRKREAQKSQVSQYYSIVLAVGVIGGLGYYLYRTKVKNVVPPFQQPRPQQQSHPRPQTNNFEMELNFSCIIKWTRRV